MGPGAVRAAAPAAPSASVGVPGTWSLLAGSDWRLRSGMGHHCIGLLKPASDGGATGVLEKPPGGVGRPGDMGFTTSARSTSQDSEEALDIGVGADVAVAVEVGRGGARWRGAASREAGEEALNIGVGADVAVAVKVGAAARR